MIYEIIDKKLKEHQKLVEKLRFGLRSLKSIKLVNRKRRLETVFERAKKLLASTEGLENDLRKLIEECLKEIPGAENAPDGTPFSTPLRKLGLSKRAVNTLKSIDIITLEDLALMRDLDEIRTMKGVGRITVNEIENLLKKTGLNI